MIIKTPHVRIPYLKVLLPYSCQFPCCLLPCPSCLSPLSYQLTNLGQLFNQPWPDFWKRIFHHFLNRCSTVPTIINQLNSSAISKKSTLHSQLGYYLSSRQLTNMCRITRTTYLCGHSVREIDSCFYGRRLGPSWCLYGHCVRRVVQRGCSDCQLQQSA